MHFIYSSISVGHQILKCNLNHKYFYVYVENKKPLDCVGFETSGHHWSGWEIIYTIDFYFLKINMIHLSF